MLSDVLPRAVRAIRDLLMEGLDWIEHACGLDVCVGERRKGWGLGKCGGVWKLGELWHLLTISA